MEVLIVGFDPMDLRIFAWNDVGSDSEGSVDRATHGLSIYIYIYRVFFRGSRWLPLEGFGV